VRDTVIPAVIIVGLLTVAGVKNPTPVAASDAPTVSDTVPVRLETRHLPNVVRVHPSVFSGGLPEGDEAFAELAGLGVKTIISVDGAIPDVAAATKTGLAYVHLPHGYDGIPDKRAIELAKAVRDLDGPIYIHCHHGKHRSPAATSVACISAGMIPPSQGVSILEVAGTDPHYSGLYQSARDAVPLATQFLDEFDVEFKSVCDVPPMAEAMVQLSHTHEDFERLSKSNWVTPADHPDLDAVHVAVLLREHFTELLRTETVRNQPADFQQWLRQSQDAAFRMEQELPRWRNAPDGKAAPEILQTHTRQIARNCRACHAKYRDVPGSANQ